MEYKWKQPDPVQFAKNLFLPGGFELTRWVKTDLLRGPFGTSKKFLL